MSPRSGRQLFSIQNKMANEPEGIFFGEVLPKCRFIQSPFVDIDDKAYQMLLHKYGVELTYSKVVPPTFFTEEYFRETFRLGEHVNIVYQVCLYVFR